MKDMTIPCLSVRSPWSWLICLGVKVLENRDWRSLPKIRGPIAIHSGLTNWTFETGEEQALSRAGCPLDDWRRLPGGVLVGVVELHGAWAVEDLPPDLRHRWDACGPVCLGVRPLYCLRRPIPAKGQLGFFPVTIPGSELVSPPKVTSRSMPNILSIAPAQGDLYHR